MFITTSHYGAETALLYFIHSLLFDMFTLCDNFHVNS